MSRSYKKPYIKDGGRSKKKEKRLASKAVRNYKEDISNGKSYKKLYCSYNICDYRYNAYVKDKKAIRYYIHPVWSDWEYIGTWKEEKRFFYIDERGFLKNGKKTIEKPQYVKKLLGWEIDDDLEILIEWEKKARRK